LPLRKSMEPALRSQAKLMWQ